MSDDILSCISSDIVVWMLCHTGTTQKTEHERSSKYTAIFEHCLREISTKSANKYVTFTS